ncbi:MAG: hypothetical protein GY953_17595, partial [bacterium]|nr:hypothetical protein [bacterium]
MRNQNTLRRWTVPAVTAILGTTFLLVLPGCGEEEPPAKAEAPAKPAVDARYATAEAILETSRGMMIGDHPDVEGVISIMHAENDLQERYIGLTRDSLGYIHLARVFQEKYDEPFLPGPLRHQGAGVSLVEKSSSEQRMEAILTTRDGEESPVHFVKIDDRWWIS